MKKNYKLFPLFLALALTPMTLLAQINPDCQFGEEIADFASLDDTPDDATNVVNAAVLTVDGQAITMSTTFAGGASVDENQINDEHLAGCIGPKLGFLDIANGADGSMTTTYSFGGPVDDFCFRFVDLDRNDQVTINGSLEGVIYTLTTDDFSFPYDGIEVLCPVYDGNNVFTSQCNPPILNINNSLRGVIDICFPGRVDELEIIFTDVSDTDGGSYTVCSFSSCIQPLPIELVEFNTSERNCEAELNWSTLTETNFSHFEVQKSNDGVNYETLGIINGIGSSVSGASYEYTDRQIQPNNYYRLKMVDFGGYFEYSEALTISASCANDVSVSNVYPNPVKGGNAKIRFTASTYESDVQMVVTDVLSRVVSQRSVDVNEGVNILDVESANLSMGTYYLYVQGEDWRTEVVRFVKQ